MTNIIRSMTGYGRGENIAEDRKFTVEVKSVNHRYNDISVKLPRVLASLEDRIKKRMMRDVFRGKTDVYINFETFAQDDIEVKLNETLAKAYRAKLKELQYVTKISAGEQMLELIAKFPDVITVEKPQKDEELIWQALAPALDEAIMRFTTMRQTEGEALKAGYFEKGRTNQGAGRIG